MLRAIHQIIGDQDLIIITVAMQATLAVFLG
jgi:hypothetical protein